MGFNTYETHAQTTGRLEKDGEARTRNPKSISEQRSAVVWINYGSDYGYGGVDEKYL